MARYRSYQLQILKMLRTTRTTPFDVVGQLLCGQRHPAFKDAVPATLEKLIDPMTRTALVALCKIARRPEDSFADARQAYFVTSEAARLCNALFWESLFPDDFPGTEVTKAAMRAGLFLFIERGEDGTDWIRKELDRSTYLSGVLSRIATRDVYRVAHDEHVDADAFIAAAEGKLTAESAV